MKINSRAEVLEILTMDSEGFYRDVMPLARETYKKTGGNLLIPIALLGYTNICRCRCLYCGMRAGSRIERYRLPEEDVKRSIEEAHALGMRKIFFVSGEDPGYEFASILASVRHAVKLGFRVCLGAGEFENEQYLALKEAGLTEYAMKFEMSNRERFNRLNPSTDFHKRLASIHKIKDMGLDIASGNIIDYPGHTPEEMADDIMLMRGLNISWAPIIPYMPAKDTPLAAEGGPGRLEFLYKEISILRLMMPKLLITAQQPGPNLAEGLASTAGNVAAIEAGANVLFVDLLPDAQTRNFSVVDNRAGMRFGHITEIAEMTGMTVSA
jgi:biotin synthase